MAAIRAQVEYLANLQGRSANLIALAEQNAVGRANIREKITEISEQVKRVADVLEMARNVAEEVAGANATQEAHLNALQSALDTAPNAEVLNQEMNELLQLSTSLNEQGPRGINEAATPFVPPAPPAGGYRYSRRRNTPTRTRKRKTPSRKRRKSKTRRR